MQDKQFINDFLSIGMYDFFYGTNKSFERHIVECLSDIYGKNEIKTLYDNHDTDGFQRLIYKYMLKNTVYENFLRDTIRYEEFKKEKEQNPNTKTDIASNIEISIISMFITRYILENPSLETITIFENNLLNNMDIVKFHQENSKKPTCTKELWESKKKILTSDIELVELKPNYLDKSLYEKFGIDFENVKKMDYRMVEELNRYIIENKDKQVKDLPKNKWFNKTILSSGNGHVDKLLMAAIIATELSILIIYLFLH